MGQVHALYLKPCPIRPVKPTMPTDLPIRLVRPAYDKVSGIAHVLVPQC